MKKIYLLAFALAAFTFSGNAQSINDDMEDYSLGPVHDAHWSNWSGNPSSEDIIVTDEYANSGSQSGFIGGDGVQDALLLLGNQASGSWEVSFQVYIPGGMSGYMNFQGETEANGAGNGGNGAFLSPNLVFNNVESASGAPGLGGAYGNVDDPTALYTWAYPQDFWFEISIIFDIDNIEWIMTINGTQLPGQPFDDVAILGAIDFFSFNANNEMYIDDIVFGSTASIGDLKAETFSVYPNPVTDILNINSKTAVDNVTVYDVLGKVVLTAQPDAISPRIDMSGLSSGAYMVQVTIGKTSKTVKVLK